MARILKKFPKRPEGIKSFLSLLTCLGQDVKAGAIAAILQWEEKRRNSKAFLYSEVSGRRVAGTEIEQGMKKVRGIHSGIQQIILRKWG